MIDSHGRAGEPFGVAEAFRLTAEAELADERVFEAAIRATGKCGQASEARELLGLMRKSGFIPTIEAYNSVLSAYQASRRLGESAAILEEMRAQGIESNAATYDIAIRASHYDLARAVALLREMQEEGLEPSHDSYYEIIRGYCRSGSSKVALTFFEEMLDYRLEPDVKIFNTLLRELISDESSRKDVHSAVELVATMVSLYNCSWRAELARLRVAPIDCFYVNIYQKYGNTYIQNCIHQIDLG